MSYDLYIDRPRGNPTTQIRLLVTENDPLSRYIQLIHGRRDQKTKQLQRSEFNKLISAELERTRTLGLMTNNAPNLQNLPLCSWFLQFIFILVKPWMSKDDDRFYVTESINPVRKDKVFNLPMMSAASWKGLLRWTAMRVRLVENKDQMSDEEFADERFRQSRLFGDEKGEEPGQSKDFAAYLDNLKQSAKELYRQKVKKYFLGDANAKEMPHHSGRMSFYPTFFDLIDVEVINPHSRKTKAGTHPIYLECVPAGAKGTFSLLYVPFDLIGRPEDEVKAEAREDLCLIAEAVPEMMLTYGFSAKRTSGYGTARDEIENGVVRIRARPQAWPLSRLSKLVDEVQNVEF